MQALANNQLPPVADVASPHAPDGAYRSWEFTRRALSFRLTILQGNDPLTIIQYHGEFYTSVPDANTSVQLLVEVKSTNNTEFEVDVMPVFRGPNGDIMDGDEYKMVGTGAVALTIGPNALPNGGRFFGGSVELDIEVVRPFDRSIVSLPTTFIDSEEFARMALEMANLL